MMKSANFQNVPWRHNESSILEDEGPRKSMKNRFRNHGKFNSMGVFSKTNEFALKLKKKKI